MMDPNIENPLNKMNDKRAARIIFYSSGLFFLVIAAFMLGFPEKTQDTLGLTAEQIKWLAISLLCGGLAEFLIGRFMFKDEAK